MDLAPMRIMAETRVGKAGIDGFAAYAGIQPADVMARMPPAQSPADVARAVMALATGQSQGGAFTVDESGLAPAA
jgi:hypothetical protein